MNIALYYGNVKWYCVVALMKTADVLSEFVEKSVYLLMFPSQDFMWDKNLLSADNLTELQKVPPVRDV